MSQFDRTTGAVNGWCKELREIVGAYIRVEDPMREKAMTAIGRIEGVAITLTAVGEIPKASEPPRRPAKSP